MSKNNNVSICGTLTEDASLSHTMHGEDFYLGYLTVPRLSGKTDTLPVMISERILKPEQLKKDVGIQIDGEFRTRRIKNKDEVRRYIFAQSAAIVDAFEHGKYSRNEVSITGKINLIREPYTGDSGRVSLDIVAEVTRPGSIKTDFIPCTLWGRNATYVAEAALGDVITIEGRVQSRTQNKVRDGGYVTKRTHIEVSAANVEIIESPKEKPAVQAETPEQVSQEAVSIDPHLTLRG